MAAKYLRDLAIYADKAIVEDFKGGFVQRFHRQSCCVSERYLSALSGKLRTDGVAKVFIEFIDHSESAVVSYPPGAPVEVWCCRLPFNFHEYQAADENGKKLLIGIALRNCLVTIAKERNWDVRLIEKTHEEAISQNFTFIGTSKASWLAPGSRYRARVAFDWKLDAIELTAVLFRNRSSTEVARKKLGEMIPESDALRDALRAQHGRWVTDTDFELATTDFLRKRWRVSFAEEIK